eukprot:481792-Hanusia_phi.AAC.2
MGRSEGWRKTRGAAEERRESKGGEEETRRGGCQVAEHVAVFTSSMTRPSQSTLLLQLSDLPVRLQLDPEDRFGNAVTLAGRAKTLVKLTGNRTEGEERSDRDAGARARRLSRCPSRGKGSADVADPRAFGTHARQDGDDDDDDNNSDVDDHDGEHDGGDGGSDDDDDDGDDDDDDDNGDGDAVDDAEPDADYERDDGRG